MKRLILILSIAFFLSNCNKEKECWTCQNNAGVGSPAEPPYEVCGDEPAPSFTDQNGNDRTRICTKQ